jgi:hypothetical protein
VSSTILYVAIVAIWIGVLVPRWLRHDSSHPGQSDLRRFSRHFGAAPAADEPEGRAGFDPDGRPRYTSFVPPEPEAHTPASHPEPHPNRGERVSSPVSGNKESMAQLYTADAPPSPVQSYGWSAQEATQQERLIKSDPNPANMRADVPHPAASADADVAGDTDAPAGEGARPDPHGADHTDARVPRPRAPHHAAAAEDAERRDRILRGRRRMLWLLLVLTAVGVGLAYLQLAAWWVMIPPAVLLVGYLLLLREAAHADAEARERRELARVAAQAHHASDAHGREQATAAAPAHETGPQADIIDLSERVEDQLYDQYTDAKLRAVGD